MLERASDLVFVMESRIDRIKLEVVRNKCGFSNGVSVTSNGILGGLGLWWKDQKVTLRSFSNRHIFVIVEDEFVGLQWVAKGVYGWSDRVGKFKIWDLMKSLVVGCSSPYIFFGLGFCGSRFTISTLGFVHFLPSAGWVERFDGVDVRHLPIYRSDHDPILLYIDMQQVTDYDKLFRFKSFWLSNENYKQVISNV